MPETTIVRALSDWPLFLKQGLASPDWLVFFKDSFTLKYK